LGGAGAWDDDHNGWQRAEAIAASGEQAGQAGVEDSHSKRA